MYYQLQQSTTRMILRYHFLLNNINQLIFVTDKHCVFFEVAKCRINLIEMSSVLQMVNTFHLYFSLDVRAVEETWNEVSCNKLYINDDH
jgi:hypothetical protein